MAAADNPWFEVLSKPQGKSTENIETYFSVQGKMLSEASGGKIEGVFAETSVVNDALSTSVDIAGAVVAISKFGEIRRTPNLNLLNADEMYQKHDYCFEIRSEAYRFRLLTLEFGPLYPVTMHADDGVYMEFARPSGRFALSKDKRPRPLIIKDDDDLDTVFKLLLSSKKLNYICNRLMTEVKEGAGEE